MQYFMRFEIIAFLVKFINNYMPFCWIFWINIYFVVFSEYCRKGRRLALCRVNSHFPGCPAAFASSAALWRNHSGNPARSSSLSTKSLKALFSFSILLLKVMPSVESSLLISRRRVWSSALRFAPERTNLFPVVRSHQPRRRQAAWFVPENRRGRVFDW